MWWCDVKLGLYFIFHIKFGIFLLAAIMVFNVCVWGAGGNIGKPTLVSHQSFKLLLNDSGFGQESFEILRPHLLIVLKLL